MFDKEPDVPQVLPPILTFDFKLFIADVVIVSKSTKEAIC